MLGRAATFVALVSIVLVGLAVPSAFARPSAAASPLPSAQTDPDIMISPLWLPSGLAETPYRQSLTATGGRAPYTFAVTGDSLPAGLGLSPDGTLAGTPLVNGDFDIAITATDADQFSKTQTARLTLYSPIVLSPPQLANGRVALAYRQVLAASGGTAPYRFTATKGTLPPGLTLSAGGVLAGTPTQWGSFWFTITASDAHALAGDRDFYLWIQEALTISPSSLPPGAPGSAYAAALSASGGTTPYTFVIGNGSLPPGLSLSSDGKLAGTPTAEGWFDFNVKATDSRGLTGQQYYGVQIAAIPLVISPAWLPDGKLNVPYRQALTASGGKLPYVFTAEGDLPPGLTLTSGGVLQGQPAASGGYSFTIRVTDASHRFGSQSYYLSIDQNSLTIGPETYWLPEGKVAEPYRQTFTASGGTTPYTFTVSEGSLPAGLVLKHDGTLRGRPSAPGSWNMTITATDKYGSIGARQYSLSIGQTLVIGPASVPAGQAGTPYKQTFTVSGGKAPYTFAAAVDRLPPGLSLSASGVLAGTPTQPGSHMIMFTVTDARGSSGNYYGYLDVLRSIAISPPLLLQGTVGRAYQQKFGASGGLAPYSFAVSEYDWMNGDLPPGVTLSTSGQLTGIPTKEGWFNFEIIATDARGIIAEQGYSIYVVQALTLNPPYLEQPGVIDEAYNAEFAASGGTAPYTFAVTSGELPPGLAFSPGGVLAGTPTQTGWFSFGITVTDAEGLTGQHYLSLTVMRPTISIEPESLPAGQLGMPYQQQLSATGGSGPYLFFATNLPAGLTLTPGGLLSGTPTSAGDWGMRINVIDARNNQGSREYTLLVQPIEISPPLLGYATRATPYQQQLTASGGVGPYIFVAPNSHAESGANSLLPGVKLGRDGLITGTPTEQGVYYFTIQVIDSRGLTSTQWYYLEVAEPLTLSSAALPDATVGAPYTVSLGAAGGSQPYSFAVTNGMLPDGLELTPNGEVTGVPTLAEVYTFEVTLTDGAGRTAVQGYTIFVN